MKTVAAILLATIFLSIALLHIYWVLGGMWGLNAAMPNTMKNHVTHISRRVSFKIATLLVAIGLLLTMYLFLVHAGIVQSPITTQYLRYATFVVCGIFLLRAIGDFKYVGFLKRVKEGDFSKYDTKYFSPLCLLITFLCLIVLLT